jgi:hypothetical protein
VEFFKEFCGLIFMQRSVNRVIPEDSSGFEEGTQSANAVPIARVRLSNLILPLDNLGSIPGTPHRRASEVFEELQLKSPKHRLRSEPQLRWGEGEKRGITESGWSPFMKTAVTFMNLSRDYGRMALIIEPRVPSVVSAGLSVLCNSYMPEMGARLAPNVEAHGFFFVRNPLTGKVDMMHRIKPFTGQHEDRRVYRDCTYFEMESKPSGKTESEKSNEMGYSFGLTSQYSDKLFHVPVVLKQPVVAKILAAVEVINEFLNSSDCGCHTPTASRIFPTLDPLTSRESSHRRNHPDSIRLEKRLSIQRHPANRFNNQNQRDSVLHRSFSSHISSMLSMGPSRIHSRGQTPRNEGGNNYRDKDGACYVEIDLYRIDTSTYDLCENNSPFNMFCGGGPSRSNNEDRFSSEASSSDETFGRVSETPSIEEVTAVRVKPRPVYVEGR